MRKFFATLLIAVPLLVNAMGPDVSQIDGKSLKWEEGAWDYFVMFKTLLQNNNRTVCTPSTITTCKLGDDQPGNPQADACVDPSVGSFFELISSQIPSDARIQAAYLTWISGLPSAKVPNGETDNTVTISFEKNDGTISHTMEVAATDTPRKLGDMQDFSFGAIESINPSNLTCTTDADCTGNAQLGEGWKCITGKCSTHTVVYNYRADVTEFFTEIHKLNTDAGITEDGAGLLGKYTVSNMECTNDPAYLATSGMVGGWSLTFVYTSEKISPKKIYFYDGFEAYRFEEGVISTSGFELPNEAVVRFTMMASEGDPGLATSSNPENPFGGAPAAEGLYISGAQKFPVGEWLQLWNDCNQAKTTDSNNLPFNYTEVYNSISSTYGWEDSFPFCVGGLPGAVDPNILEYAMDVDTFILDAKDPAFAPHLIKGDQFLNFKIGANQDQIYTNLIVVSIDTKSPKFDIPDSREKNSCTCSKTEDFICSDRPFYFTIRVENWGENIADNVTVQDELPRNVNYIAGSTEMLTTKDGVTGKWEKVEDVSGEFPFKNATKVMDSMYYCDKESLTCADKVMIRFKVKPIDTIQKNEVIENTAVITDNSGIAYYSNSSIPLRLKQGDCPALTECPEPPKELCGPTSDGPECEKKEDCGEGYLCEDGKCVADESSLTENAKITFAQGKNSPSADGSSIIIPNPSKDLVAAQFTLIAEGKEDKNFKLNGVSFAVTSNDTATTLGKFRLVYDADGDGIAGSKEKTIATLESAKSNTVSFQVLNAADRNFKAGVLHYFLLVLDAAYNGEPSNNVVFNFDITGKASFQVSDKGDPEMSGSEISFADFKFEPANGFIVTKGNNDPEVPSMDKMNGTIPVLQLRTKSMQGSDILESISFKPYLKSVKFGEGINGAAIYHDTDSDGKVTSKDKKLAEITSFDSIATAIFKNLDLSYTKGEEKHLLITLSLGLSEGQLAQIQIGSGKVGLSTDREVIELPVTSKAFLYECAEGETGCYVDEDESGCSVTAANDSNNSLTVLIMMIIAGISSAFVLFTRKR